MFSNQLIIPLSRYAIMELCWAKNPKARPTFIELIDMLLPDINQKRFREVSFYFTQRQQESSANDTLDGATASTPMRTQWMDNPNANGREDSDAESEIAFFPPTRNSTSHYRRNNSTGESTMECNRAYSVHSSDGNRVVVAASSDDSKGSKVSSTSNGSIPNGRANFVPCRTTTC